MSTLPSLLDVPGLQELEQVCQQFNIQFIAHGGLVRRYATRLAEQQQPVYLTIPGEKEFDLFDLVPFLSDIDLIHTASRDMTTAIINHIHAVVPLAECFRWELRSLEENKLFDKTAQNNGIVPVNLMSLATDARSGIDDPWDGQRDIKRKTFRYIRNGFYSRSPLFRKRRDLEFFSVLLYFRVLLEANIPSERFEEQPGWNDAKAVITDSIAPATISALQGNAYLRARLHYILKGMAVASGSVGSIVGLLSLSGLDILLGNIDIQCVPFLAVFSAEISSFSFDLFPGNILSTAAGIVPILPLPPLQLPVVVASGWLGGDSFRFHHRTGDWETGEAATKHLNTLLQLTPIELGVVSDGRSLGENQEVLLSSPALNIARGVSQSSRVNEGVINEFIHFAIPKQEGEAALLRRTDSRNMAVVVAFTGNDSQNQKFASFVPLSAVCSLENWKDKPTSDGVLLLIRISGGSFFEAIHELFERWRDVANPMAYIFVLGWIGDSPEA